MGGLEGWLTGVEGHALVGQRSPNLGRSASVVHFHLPTHLIFQQLYYNDLAKVAPLAARFVMTVSCEDGTFTVEASILGGTDLMELREEVEATKLLSLRRLFGSEAGESSERLEAGGGVRLLCGKINVAILLSV